MTRDSYLIRDTRIRGSCEGSLLHGRSRGTPLNAFRAPICPSNFPFTPSNPRKFREFHGYTQRRSSHSGRPWVARIFRKSKLLLQYEWVRLYGKPLIIRLQLILIEVWKTSIYNCVRTLKRHVKFRSKRTFRLCWGQLERLKPRKKISKIGLNWLKETLDFSFLCVFLWCLNKCSTPIFRSRKPKLTTVGESLRRPRDTLYPLKFALTSPTSGGRSFGRYSSLADSSHGVQFF
jgi:hypothetical protein